MTLDQLFEGYSKSQGYNDLAARSKESYGYCANALIKHFGDKPVEAMRRSDFIKFQNDHAAKPAFANLAVRVASIMFAYAVDLDILPANPVARLKKLKTGSHTKWTLDEVKAMISIDDRKISTAVALAWYTGQRESDILSMRWASYSDGYISVTQQKTGLEMKIKAHPDLVEYLSKVRGDEPDSYYIVSGATKMSGPAFRNMLKRRTNKLNIDKVFHGIRKGVACSLAENGRPISEIAAIMGHKSMRMAAYYAEQASSTKLTENAVSNLSSTISYEKSDGYPESTFSS